MKLWKENDLKASGLAKDLKIGFALCKIGLRINLSPYATVCGSFWAFEILALCALLLETRNTMFIENLQHSFEYTSTRMTFREIKRLWLACAEGGISHFHLLCFVTGTICLFNGLSIFIMLCDLESQFLPTGGVNFGILQADGALSGRLRWVVALS